MDLYRGKTSSEVEITLQRFVAIFIDALGQKNNLYELESKLLSETHDMEKLKESIDKTYSRVSSTRNGFFNYLSILTNDSQKQSFVGCHPTFNSDFKKYMAQKVYFEHMSDSIFIYFPLNNESDAEYNSPMLFHAILAIILLQTKAISEGIFFRGGIDVGFGALLPEENYTTNLSLYGPVLSRVAKLEAKCAYWPRIVVGSELCDYIKSGHLNVGTDLSRVECLTFYHDWCNELIAYTDDFAMLKVFGEASKKYFGSEYPDMVMKSLIEIKRNIDIAKGDAKVVERYSTLFKYILTQSGIF